MAFKNKNFIQGIVYSACIAIDEHKEDVAKVILRKSGITKDIALTAGSDETDMQKIESVNAWPR